MTQEEDVVGEEEQRQRRLLRLWREEAEKTNWFAKPTSSWRNEALILKVLSIVSLHSKYTSKLMEESGTDSQSVLWLPSKNSRVLYRFSQYALQSICIVNILEHWFLRISGRTWIGLSCFLHVRWVRKRRRRRRRQRRRRRRRQRGNTGSGVTTRVERGE
jgi:hypothetical protein